MMIILALLILLLLPNGLVLADTDDNAFVPGDVAKKVFHLTKDNFKQAIGDPANPLWLLKFYAPWCGHCKKMAPVLDKVAPQLAGQLAIGKIDCTLDQKFCSEFQVRGYPTLKFSVDGVISDYPGGRSESEILSFAKKMGKPDVQLVTAIDDAHKFASEEADDGVAFLAYHPNLQGESVEDKLSSTLVTQVYAQVARQLKASGHFLLLDSASIEDEEFRNSVTSLGQSREKPFICRFEANVETQCYKNDMGKIEKSVLHEYVSAANIPTVASLGPSNLSKIGRKGRPLVVGVVKSASQTAELQEVKKVLAQYATTGPEKIRNKYYYGWIDGKAWAKFLVQFEVTPEESPQIFLLNLPRKRYWQNATYKLNIDDFLQAVEDGIIDGKTAGKSGFDGYVERAAHVFMEYMPWSAMLAVAFFVLLLIGIVSCVTPGDDLRPPYPPTSPFVSSETNVTESNDSTQLTESKKEK